MANPETTPRFVPLPDLRQHTDSVTFGNLGLPVGFDQEQLLVNVRGIERIQSVARLGHISVVGMSGEVSQRSYSVGSIQADGSTTLGAVKKREKEPLSHISVKFPDPSLTIVGDPRVIIRVNKEEIKQRTLEKPKEYERGPLDAGTRAKYLNRSLKEGLSSASKKANVDLFKIALGSAAYTIMNTILWAYGSSTEGILTGSAVASPVVMNAIILISGALSYSRNGKDFDGDDPMKHWRLYRQSMFVGAAFDRALAGSALAATTALVKAKK